jgi:hypothetical protein
LLPSTRSHSPAATSASSSARYESLNHMFDMI